MTEPESQFYGCWRFRFVNKVSVFSIDHTKQSSERLFRDCKSLLDAAALVTRNFLSTPLINSHLHEWARDNPYCESHLRYMLISVESLDGAKHEEEQRSVRYLSLPPRTSMKPKIFDGSARDDVGTLTVVFLRVGFRRRNTKEIFNEFILLGLLPQSRFKEAPCLSDLILNTSVDKAERTDKTLMRELRLPMARFSSFDAFDAVNVDSIGAEKLLSFCIRWHVACKGRRANHFFDAVVGVSASNNAREEKITQLLAPTLRFFRSDGAVRVLFGDASLLMCVTRFWETNQLRVEQRLWMVRQLCDALSFAVDEFVMARGALARRLFFDTAVSSLLRFAMPYLKFARVGDNAVRIDFLSQAQSRIHVDLHRLSERRALFERDGEVALEYTPGFVTIALSTACAMYVEVFTEMLRILTSESKHGIVAAPLRSVPDEAAFPLNGGDVYPQVRPTQYDDFPVGGFVHKTALAVGSSSSASSTVASNSSAEIDSLRLYNLPVSFGMADRDGNGGGASALRHSIPIRQSHSRIAVSTEALHSVCSNVDIEDLADTIVVVEENPVTLLHKRYALPLCARQYTHDIVDGSGHAAHAARKYLYRFLKSLRLDEIDDEQIREFLMLNTEPAREREYRAQFESLRKFTTSMLEKRVEERMRKGSTREDALARESCCASCEVNASEKRDGVYPCPYRDAAHGIAGAAEKLSATLKRINPLLAGDAAAIERIVGAARTEKITGACLQEFVETRRKLNGETEALANPVQTFKRPFHYVYASAEHTERSKPKE